MVLCSLGIASASLIDVEKSRLYLNHHNSQNTDFRENGITLTGMLEAGLLSLSHCSTFCWRIHIIYEQFNRSKR